MNVLLPIQALRALAALAVLIGHFQAYTATPASNYWLPYNKIASAGVDLFFVISGFVMVYSSEKLFGQSGAVRDFLTRRVIRIVPLYWAATTLYVLLAIAIPSLGVSYSPKFLISSYLFIPVARPDGTFNPVVGQGWTLNLEMLFYLIFALTLVASRKAAVAAASLALIALVCSRYFVPADAHVLRFLTTPSLLEFVMGMALGLVYPYARAWPRRFNVVLVAAAIAGFFALHVLADVHRVIAHGIPATLLVAGATFGGYAPNNAGWRALGIMGDASYALYLFHAFPIHLMLASYSLLDITIEAHRALCLAGTVVSAMMMAIAIYFLFERPVTKALRALQHRRRTARPAIAGADAPHPDLIPDPVPVPAGHAMTLEPPGKTSR